MKMIYIVSFFLSAVMMNMVMKIGLVGPVTVRAAIRHKKYR
jgi:hypothetical protein